MGAHKHIIHVNTTPILNKTEESIMSGVSNTEFTFSATNKSLELPESSLYFLRDGLWSNTIFRIKE